MNRKQSARAGARNLAFVERMSPDPDVCPCSGLGTVTVHHLELGEYRPELGRFVGGVDVHHKFACRFHGSIDR